MTSSEAKAYITWFRSNHLPKGSDFIRTSSGRDINLDLLNDEDAIFVAQQFESMLNKAMEKK
jgi:hypothetical protein